MALTPLAPARLFLLDLETLSQADLLPMLAWLGPSELIRYQNFALELRRRQFLVGRMILRHTVAAALGRPARDITLLERPDLAPQLLVGGQAHGYGFSISHSGNWVACICSAEAKVGLDVEVWNPARNHEALAKRSFDQEDVTWFSDQPDQLTAFYQLWSRKEARYKLQQNHLKPAIEFCVEIQHPAMSVVVMADRAIEVSTVWMAPGSSEYCTLLQH